MIGTVSRSRNSMEVTYARPDHNLIGAPSNFSNTALRCDHVAALRAANRRTWKVDPMGPTQKLLWKLYVGVIGAVTTIAAQRLIKAGWKLVTGDDPPSPTDPDTPVITAMTWALASGVGVGVTQLLTQRMAARHWGKEIGSDTPEDTGKIKVKF